MRGLAGSAGGARGLPQHGDDLRQRIILVIHEPQPSARAAGVPLPDPAAALLFACLWSKAAFSRSLRPAR